LKSWHLLAIALAGCTGLTSGENSPGQDTYLESGAIAVDSRTDTSFVLSRSASGQRQQLYAIAPGATRAKPVLDLSGTTNVRVVFPKKDVLILAERGGATDLILVDQDSLLVRQTAVAQTIFNDTRVSPSGKWVLAAEGPSIVDEPNDVIDAETLAVHPVPADPAGGGSMIATWLHGSDVLATVVSYAAGNAGQHARILAWDVGHVADAGFPTGNLWPDPAVDLDVDGVAAIYTDSLDAIGISADDGTWVFPLARGTTPETPVLEIVDVGPSRVTEVTNARGPVGFTPDDATIVSYRDDPNVANAADLLLVGRDDQSTNVVRLPTDIDLPSYFVSHAGNMVLVTQTLGTASMVLYDVDHGQLTRLAGPQVQLDDFVASGSTLYVANSGLFRVDLAAATVDSVPLAWAPSHVNILPDRNLLVTDDSLPVVHFVDLATLRPTSSVTLPSP
jgi:hypothetical protein